MNDITLRDHIAVEAMKALIMEPEWVRGRGATVDSITRDMGGGRADDTEADLYATSAYALADAMLAARERVA